MNTEKITMKAQYFHILIHLIISETIKQYTNYLVKFIKQLVRDTMLLIKSTADYFCSWWTSEVDEVICRVRKIQRHENHDKKIIKTNRHKKKSYIKSKYHNFEITFIKQYSAAKIYKNWWNESKNAVIFF